jgi:hypothetical protein
MAIWSFSCNLFLGIFLTGFGSAYYHLEPSDQTLFWDRLPIAIGTGIGVFSLLLWRWTGDLRLYAWVQFFPCLALLLIFLLFAPRFSGTIYWLLGRYALWTCKAVRVLR